MARHHNEGHGRRLTAAFEALEAFPVLAESRNRVLRLFAQERPATADVVTAVESDVALAIATLRLANRVDGRTRGRVDSVVRAVSVLSPRRRAGAREPRAHVRLLRAQRRSGRARPSASACTASRRSAPPTGSPPSSATRTATA